MRPRRLLVFAIAFMTFSIGTLLLIYEIHRLKLHEGIFNFFGDHELDAAAVIQASKAQPAGRGGAIDSAAVALAAAAATAAAVAASVSCCCRSDNKSRRGGGGSSLGAMPRPGIAAAMWVRLGRQCATTGGRQSGEPPLSAPPRG